VDHRAGVRAPTRSSAFEARVRAVLAGLREALDFDDPQLALVVPDARAIIDDAWSVLSDVLTASASEPVADLLAALRRLGQVDHSLRRVQELD
jgi:hypothetical protein